MFFATIIISNYQLFNSKTEKYGIMSLFLRKGAWTSLFEIGGCIRPAIGSQPCEG